MEIKNLIGELNPYANGKVQESAGTASQQRTQQAAENSGADVVQLSSSGKLLAAATSAAKDAPDVRAEKVRDLKEQVKNGTYKPDLQKAARNLVREDLSQIV